VRVVLAYSGGLDTSVIAAWLREEKGAEVICFYADLGQGGDLGEIRERAFRAGAVAFHAEDLREEFVRNYAFRVLRAGAVYQGKYLLGTAMARPLIARRLVELARRLGADAVAHGATGKGNDQVRFEVTVRALDPSLEIIAPWREWKIRSRTEAIEYARERGIPVPATPEEPFSRDGNLWHLSHEGGVLEDPWEEPPPGLLQLVRSLEATPDVPAYITVGFERGWPVSLDGERRDPVSLLERLNGLAGEHGVGVVVMVEDRLVGLKSRGVYETPGGTVLYLAHRELESLVLDRRTRFFKEEVARHYAELVYDGLWFSPLREALDAFVEATQEPVTGEVRVKLYKGSCLPVGARSPYSLYRQELSTFEEGEGFDQAAAGGFIRLFGLPLEVRARVRGEGAEERR